jgi:hypothetical protein
VSFKQILEVFGGDRAVDTDEVTLKYIIYDIASEYWHEPFVEDVLEKMDKKQLMYWLGYREIRSRIEEKRQREAKKGVKKR